MQASMTEWLAGVGSSAFAWSAALFVLINGAAVAAIVVTRDRSLVNRWTGRLLAANLVLAGTGLGVPLVTSMAQLAMAAFAPAVQSAIPAQEATDAAPHAPSSAVEMPIISR